MKHKLTASTNVVEAAAEMLEVARKNYTSVTSLFNGIRLKAYCDDSVNSIVSDYEKKLLRRNCRNKR